MNKIIWRVVQYACVCLQSTLFYLVFECKLFKFVSYWSPLKQMVVNVELNNVSAFSVCKMNTWSCRLGFTLIL
jgi:hypothetical protein